MKQPVRTQSIMFTLLGDDFYLKGIFKPVWIGTYINIFNELGYSEKSTRLALSRMCANGWLKRVKDGKKSYYFMAERCLKLLGESEEPVILKYKQKEKWDQKWCFFVYSIPKKKSKLSMELRKGLTWLGFGSMSYGIWISPHKHKNALLRLVDQLGIKKFTETFIADGRDLTEDRELAKKCWDLEKINAFYSSFIEEFSTRKLQLIEQYGDNIPDNICFKEKVKIVHQFRKFPFVDPYLPRELWPEGWLADKAIELYEEFREMVVPGANRFLEYHLELKKEE
ncbi:MAG: PaaX family transcriptional regulator C-terminal domain-containing protein [Thermincola sp.]|nr:PaaX family transcriptional regulator C-terminal domain-containing protein [Thermincola sp.]MDT3704570.1 PaaX family transcriptional regulator C-terminal domain-containing protein [Thermincola sp.]